MRATAFARLATQVYDAALTPELWPDALEAISKDLGGIGAAYIVRNRATGGVEWLSYAGPCTDGKADYVNHYAQVNPFAPLLDAAPKGSWLQMTACIAEDKLRNDEGYNDFYLKRGVDDIVGARIAETASHNARLGLHHGVAQPELTLRDARCRKVLQLVTGAAQLQLELAGLRWKSAATLRALDEVAAGVVIADAEGRVIEMNRAAERIAQRGDGLIVRNDWISALRSFEDAKLAKLIAAAASVDNAPEAARMLIGRSAVPSPYVVTVAPLGISRGVVAHPLALIFIDDLEAPSPSRDDLHALFGLSPAESRLATALARGQKLRDIASASNVQITTLRTQLSSVLKKVGAQRQNDLVRILARLDTIKPY